LRSAVLPKLNDIDACQRPQELLTVLSQIQINSIIDPKDCKDLRKLINVLHSAVNEENGVFQEKVENFWVDIKLHVRDFLRYLHMTDSAKMLPQADSDVQSVSVDKSNKDKFVPPVLVITTSLDDHFQKMLRNKKKLSNLPMKLNRNNQTVTYFGREVRLSADTMSTISELCTKYEMPNRTDKTILQQAVTEVANVFKSYMKHLVV
jgi:hypothetical protein